MSKKKRYVPDGLNCEKLRKQALELSLLARQEAAILQQLPATFAATLVVHMKRLDISKDKLAETSLLSAKSIQNFRTGRNTKATLNSVLALCVGLGLTPLLSEDLLYKSGYVLKNTPCEIFYRQLLNICYKCTIHECNAVLLICGFDILIAE